MKIHQHTHHEKNHTMRRLWNQRQRRHGHILLQGKCRGGTNTDKRYIAILINPQGEECFLAYGPKSKNKGDAIRFVSFGVAHRAAMNHFGRGDQGFWDCERKAARNAEREHSGWTSRVEEVA